MDWHGMWQRANRRLARRLQGLESAEGVRAVLGRLGELQRLEPLASPEAARWLGGRPVLGVDGSVHTYGSGFPYYLAVLRAAAVPTRGEAVVRQAAYSPLFRSGWLAAGAAQDSLRLRRWQARLEAAVAAAGTARHRPALVLMDGPLVRFDREAKKSFRRLVHVVAHTGAALVGVVESVESSVLRHHLGHSAPPGWAGRWDREVLWAALAPGEVLALRAPMGSGAAADPVGDPGEVEAPAGGGVVPEAPETGAREPEAHASGAGDRFRAAPEPGVPIRRWFLRPGADPGAIALDFLEWQVQQDPAMPWRVAAFLLALTPADGRGIPIWTDLVDRHVRITEAEVQQAAHAHLDPTVRARLLAARRHLRPRF